MAKVLLNPPYKSLHGRLGNIIHYNVCGFQYARSYTIPRNPRTEKQQKQRKALAEKVKLWQDLPYEEKKIYNRQAKRKPLSGYNIFMSNSLLGITHERVMQLHKAAQAVTIVSDSYQIGITSVSDSQKPVHGQINSLKHRFMAIKPPGITTAAA